MGRYPLDLTTLLVAVHATLMVATCLLMAFRAAGFLSWFVLDTSEVWQGSLWQLGTYAFVHSPSGLLWFAVEMYMLYAFGREVERFVGRRAFIMLYALLLLAPAVCLTLAGLYFRLGLAGSAALHFGVFIAFTTIYPSVEMLLRIQAKWIALVLAAIGTLAALAGHDWGSLIVLWASIAAAFFFIRLRGVGPELVWWSDLKERFAPKPKFTIVQKPSARRTVEPEGVHESIDPILEKISKQGIGSLTENERAVLDRARTRLLKNNS